MTVVSVNQAGNRRTLLFECNRYGEERGRWRGVVKMKDDMHEYDIIKGYQLESYENR